MRNIYDKCRNCGATFDGPGRVDRQFCCDNCRAQFHYRNTRAMRITRYNVLKTLDTNYDILSLYLERDIHSVDIQELVRSGYSLNNVTAYRKVRGHDEYRCFDIKYYLTPSRIIMLEKVIL